MTRYRVRHWIARAFTALLLAPLAGLASRPASAQVAATAIARLPERLSDADFWALMGQISEPGGYFQIEDNFTSNEAEIGQYFTMLRERGTNGGVYMGVGPEQNLTYIAAIRPQMAFIVDIRRQAVMQHLMFKAVFEMSADRADFISKLFSKARPTGLDASTPIQAIWDAYTPAQSDSVTWQANYAAIVDLLTRTHGFTFTADEMTRLKYVYDSFYWYGPAITTRVGSSAGGRGGNQSTFAQLTGYSPDASGQPRSFLSSEENFQYVKSLHDRNLIVPVSGDFAGPRAIRTIGAWLKDRGATVSAFYVSNVEQYLFREGRAQLFYANVATLPVNEASVFIRPYSLRRVGFAPQSFCPMAPFVVAAANGRVMSNSDALGCPQ